jgi:hypothetical protein
LAKSPHSGSVKEWSMLKDPNTKSVPTKPVAKAAPTKPAARAEAMAGQAADRPAPTTATKTTAAKAAPPIAARQPAGRRPSDDLERRIQQRAYELWENEGRPQGREQDHWQQAEREVARRGVSGRI